MMVPGLIGVIFVFLATRYGMRRLLPVIVQSGFARPNYKGDPVPAVGGIVPALAYSAWLMLSSARAAFFPFHFTVDAAVAGAATISGPLLIVTVGMAFVGFIDDVLGDGGARGVRGHFGALLGGRLTTGAVKALYGCVVGLAAAAPFADGGWQLLLCAAIVALSANTVNLLDVRPGRALKGTLFALGVLLVGTMRAETWVYVAPFIAALLAYAPFDLRGRAMLGDVGANVAGGVFGVAAVASASVGTLVVLAFVLLGLHVASERMSFSAVIERVPLLRLFDGWGRG